MCDFGERLGEVFWFIVENYFCGDVGHSGRNVATSFGDDVDWFTNCVAKAAVHAETNAFFAKLDNIAVALLHGGESVVAHESFTFGDFGFTPFFNVASHKGDFDAGLIKGGLDSLDFGTILLAVMELECEEGVDSARFSFVRDGYSLCCFHAIIVTWFLRIR